MHPAFQIIDKVLAEWRGFFYNDCMLKKKQDKQLRLEMVCIDQLVPKDHLSHFRRWR